MSAFGPRGGRWRRIRALIWKESLQVVRDPSSFVVAFVLPAILLILFGYGISFDATRIRVGLVVEAPTAETAWFLASLSNTPFLRRADRRRTGAPSTTISPPARSTRSSICPATFRERIARGDTAGVEIVTDGSDPNTASLATGYLQGAWQSWLDQRALARRRAGAAPGIDVAAARLVQPRARKPALPGARFDRADPDDDRLAADRAGGRARVGARHDRGAARDARSASSNS